MSDLMNRTGGLGYTGGALVLTTCLLIVSVIWWRSGQTLDVEEIATFKGESLYWVATLISNTLGTSSGDFLAHDTGLGPRLGALVLGAALALILAAHYLIPIAGTLLFWLAYVLTRPFGADAENALSKPRDEGGLDWGEVIPSGILGALLIGLVAYQTVTHRPQTSEAGDRGS